MFEVLSEERAQLCLTLAEGADTVNVYLAPRAESWPVGMVPGFCTVQVIRVRVRDKVEVSRAPPRR